MMPFMKINGQKFGRLTVIRRFRRKKLGELYCRCQCECGNVITTRGYSLKSGKTRSCGCLNREVAKTLKELPFGQAAKNRVISQYKCHAKDKGGWFLSNDLAIHLFTGPCRYCNSLPSAVSKNRYKLGDFIYNGIDRLNSSLGYISENVDSCCRLCNIMKHNLSEKEFYQRITAIYTFSILYAGRRK